MAFEVGDDVQVASVSGGTDVCTAFVGACPELPVRAWELQCRALGAKVEAFDADGAPLIGQVGELVVSEPMPSMPIALWGDDDGTRLHGAYFDVYPGVWRHGDWITITDDGACIVHGRSDATLNRGGVRMGSAEFYRVLDSLPTVADSLVVDTTELGREGRLILFLQPAAPGDTAAVFESLHRQVVAALGAALSPRHVPDVVVEVGELPRTLNGKRIEVPVRRILLGAPPEAAVASGALANPEALVSLLGVCRRAGLLPAG